MVRLVCWSVYKVPILQQIQHTLESAAHHMNPANPLMNWTNQLTNDMTRYWTSSCTQLVKSHRHVQIVKPWLQVDIITQHTKYNTQSGRLLDHIVDINQRSYWFQTIMYNHVQSLQDNMIHFWIACCNQHEWNCAIQLQWFVIVWYEHDDSDSIQSDQLDYNWSCILWLTRSIVVELEYRLTVESQCVVSATWCDI